MSFVWPSAGFKVDGDSGEKTSEPINCVEVNFVGITDDGREDGFVNEIFVTAVTRHFLIASSTKPQLTCSLWTNIK